MKIIATTALALLSGLSLLQAQEVEFGNPTKESSFHHLPVPMGNNDDGGFSVLHMTKVKPNGVHLMRDEGNKKAMGSSALIGYGVIRSDRAINDPENYMSGKGVYFIEHYDKNANPTSRTELNLKYKDDIFSIKKMVRLNGKQTFIGTYYNEKSKVTTLYAAELKDNNQLDYDNLKELDQTNYKFGSGNSRNTYKVLVSEDQSKLLVAVWGLKSSKDQKRFLRTVVLDKDLNELSRHEESMEAYEKLSIEDLRFSNDGTVYFLSKVYLSDDEKDDDENKQPFKYVLFHVGGDNEMGSLELKFPNQFVSNATLDIKDNALMIMGFLSNKSVKYQDGYFYKQFEPGTLTETQSLKESFSADFRKEFIGAKDAGKNKELQDYYIRKVFKDKDGHLIMVAERFWIEVHADNNSSTLGGIATSYDFVYKYLDMMVFSLDPSSGTINWQKKIRKSQRTVNDGAIYSTFLAFMDGDNLKIMYNANKKDPEDPLTNPAGATSYMATVQCSSGETTVVPVFNAKEEKAIFVPVFRAATADEKRIIYTVKGTQFQFGLLTP